MKNQSTIKLVVEEKNAAEEVIAMLNTSSLDIFPNMIITTWAQPVPTLYICICPSLEYCSPPCLKLLLHLHTHTYYTIHVHEKLASAHFAALYCKPQARDWCVTRKP